MERLEKTLYKFEEKIYQQLVSTLEEMQKKIAKANERDDTAHEIILHEGPGKRYVINAYDLAVNRWSTTELDTDADTDHMSPSEFVKKYIKTPEDAIKLTRELLKHKDV